MYFTVFIDKPNIHMKLRCGDCKREKIIRLTDIIWDFPCKVHYHCSQCGNYSQGNYSEHCDLAKKIKSQRP